MGDMRMKKIADEELMAYADLELGDEERKKVELALEGNAEGQARLEDFKTTGAAISHYATILNDPAPEHLKNLVRKKITL